MFSRQLREKGGENRPQLDEGQRPKQINLVEYIYLTMFYDIKDWLKKVIRITKVPADIISYSHEVK